MFPRLNAPITLYFNQDGSAEKAHVINVYIHLYDVNRRRRAIIERAAKAEETRVQAMAAPPLPPPTAVKRKGQVLNQQPTQQAQPASRQNGSANHRSAQTSWQPPLPQPVAQPPPPPVARPPPPPLVEHYPAMPTNQHPINWPMSPRLPDFPGVWSDKSEKRSNGWLFCCYTKNKWRWSARYDLPRNSLKNNKITVRKVRGNGPNMPMYSSFKNNFV